MTYYGAVTKVASGLVFVYVLLYGMGVGITNANAVPETCDRFELLNRLSIALVSEQSAKSTLERVDNPKADAALGIFLEKAVGDLEDAQSSIVDFAGLLTSACTEPAGPISPDTANFCANKVFEARRLDTYVANVVTQAADTVPGEEDFVGVFAFNHKTNINLLDRAIELKKDCLQRLINEGIVDGTEPFPTTTLP